MSEQTRLVRSLALTRSQESNASSGCGIRSIGAFMFAGSRQIVSVGQHALKNALEQHWPWVMPPMAAEPSALTDEERELLSEHCRTDRQV